MLEYYEFKGIRINDAFKAISMKDILQRLDKKVTRVLKA